MLFKKNIWSLFYLILAISSLTLLSLFFSKYQTLEHAIFKELSSLNRLISNNFHSTLVENELLLDILGNNLLENQTYLDQTKSQQLLKKMLDAKPELAGFGLVDPQGRFLSLSGSAAIDKLPNLLEMNASKESFERALKSERMVLGSTYFFAPLDAWVVPLRKALRDEFGQVVAVMTTGIRIDDRGFLGKTDLGQNRGILFANAYNQSRIYISGIRPEQYPQYYSENIPPAVIDDINSQLIRNYGVSITQAQSGAHEGPYFFEHYSNTFEHAALQSAAYDPDYGVWAIVAESASRLNHTLIKTFVDYLLIFIVFNAIIFWLIKTIHRNESRTRQTLQFHANHDPLTGLYNRYHLQQIFKQRGLQKTHAYSVLFIDLDNFKNINDAFGHGIGDKILVQVSKRLQSFVSQSEQIFRFGGDEFVVILFDSDKDIPIAREIIQTLSQSYEVDGMSFNIGASIGIARSTEENFFIDTLLSQADMAMYEAKKRKNSVEVFSDEIKQLSDRKMFIEHHLRRAMEHGEIYVVYQPQFNRQGELYGVECLARWENPELGFVSPDEFIHIAEEIGIMPGLGLFITQTALNAMAALQLRSGHYFRVSVNVSVKQFLDPHFYRKFMAAIRDSGLQSSDVTLEVTESLFIEELDRVLPVLQQLHAQHVSIALDDFGTGYSSLCMLRKLPINELKIDRSFVEHMLQDLKDQGLVKSIIEIAQKVGMHTLAEGVEVQQQAELLAKFGCDVYQGYLYSKPLKLNEFEAFLESYEAEKKKPLNANV
ncbi:bifunctional diguanylate cyclase/phosphodiesterase [Thiomicrorhabdus cannonii]|uniref:bifunctional diguanylate cyclase/phosphodiesterase n=1 Tax=Thiomicrorhabdus cannonii TaxID=2748011 RepID=UPI0015C18852|nr:EAL domain-containing protein [Thiomicrorhabdus cannonii]